MQKSALMFVLLSLISLAVASPTHAAEKRCGWYENPTPSNHFLTDREGTWIIGAQGSYLAEGGENLQEFPDSKWVQTNAGSYGYGCACLDVETDHTTKKVLRVLHLEVKPLSACRRDKNLKEPESPLQ